MAIPAVNELRQFVFTNRLAQWTLIKQELPEFAGAAMSSRLVSNTLHRRMERDSQNAITEAIRAANVALQASRQNGNITVDAALAWSNTLDEYAELAKKLKIKDFKEGLDKEEKKGSHNEL